MNPFGCLAKRQWSRRKEGLGFDDITITTGTFLRQHKGLTLTELPLLYLPAARLALILTDWFFAGVL